MIELTNNRVTLLFAKAKYIIRNEGWIALIKATIVFLRYKLFFYRTYYLRENRLHDSIGREVPPLINEYSLEIISYIQQVEELTKEGYEFKPWYSVSKNRFDKGAVAFCIFIGKELGHISWCALNDEAWNSLDEPPIKVNFANNESATGGYWTNPKYRGKGLAYYTTQLILQYLRDNGRVVAKGARATDNYPAQRVSRANSRTYAIGCHLKILWWKSWKETPID